MSTEIHLQPGLQNMLLASGGGTMYSVCRIKVLDLLGVNRSPKQNFTTSAFLLYHIFTKHKLYLALDANLVAPFSTT